jgi:hypothetical protein
LRKLRTLISFACLTAIAIAAPTAAMAVNVSSNDGFGVQSPSRWYSNGAILSGDLRSTAGSPVYYSGLVVINNCGDHDDGRYTNNVTSRSATSASGTVTGTIGFWPCSFDGVKARVCRDINNLPDSCGSWSAIMRP